MSTIDATLRRVITAGCAAVALAVVAVAPATAASADASPPPGKVTVDVLTVNGSGCPAGSTSATEAPDNTGFHIAYNDFIARDGVGSAPTVFRKNCQVSLRIQIPQGFTYAVARADYRGRVSLPAGGTALHRTNYYFQGDAANHLSDHAFAGPLSGSWHSTDVADVATLVYAPCGQTVNLNVNTELRVSSSSGVPGWISMRSSDGDVDTLIQFSWKTC
jgi:hypothetical protein